MKRPLLLMLLFAVLGGCYSSTQYYDARGDDARDARPDPRVDDTPDVPPDPGYDDASPDGPWDAPCLQPAEPVIEYVEYSSTVAAYAPFTFTMYHEPLYGPSAWYDLSERDIRVTLTGMICACDPCVIGMPSTIMTSLTIGGLSPGEYRITLRDQSYPLVVTGGDCMRQPLNVDYGPSPVMCPEEARVGQEADVEFSGYGYGCGCGGYVETTVDFAVPDGWGPGVAAIGSTEVICNPEQCCLACDCIDSFDVKMPLYYPGEGVWDNYANDQWLCRTMVFGDDGCTDWRPGSVGVSSYESVVYTSSGLAGSSHFTITLSTGMCCGGADANVVEERSSDGTINLRPMYDLCEGDCCMMCECMDGYILEYDVAGLSVGRHTVCVEGAPPDGCYTVEVVVPVR